LRRLLRAFRAGRGRNIRGKFRSPRLHGRGRLSLPRLLLMRRYAGNLRRLIRGLAAVAQFHYPQCNQDCQRQYHKPNHSPYGQP
jgi:hypothetical protein